MRIFNHVILELGLEIIAWKLSFLAGNAVLSLIGMVSTYLLTRRKNEVRYGGTTLSFSAFHLEKQTETSGERCEGRGAELEGLPTSGEDTGIWTIFTSPFLLDFQYERGA